MTGPDEVYATLNARLPYHAGASVAGLAGMPVSLSESWLPAQIELAGRMYRCTDRAVLGVLWWYSASSMLLAPVAESVVVAGVALDPRRVTLYSHVDGRLPAARSDAVCTDVSDALEAVLSAFVASVSGVTGARARTLWAIATDSLGNRVLWAGGSPEVALSLAGGVAELPTPRFVSVNGRDYVRRGSCCLVYEATDVPKCVSCPRRHPADRLARLRAL
ncbi:(2Fe-2S)-binding protein [Actinokineospora enzanensis]|uniref:(2Fe-2S)-binding protein n=1 Tax=Actinokineospora enzanensis TaxID=155975 RepID=UPI00036C91AC|nr:(2Fe-2S)-binding protein [Actinokineospora enzanensis]